MSIRVYVSGQGKQLQLLEDEGGRSTTLSDIIEHWHYNFKGKNELTPLQIPAAPYSPAFRAWTSETMIREPEFPMACPRATAPLQTKN